MENTENKIVDYPSMSEIDIAYKILFDKGEAIYYKDLITEVIEKKRKTIQSIAVAISEIYTMINMDGRFQHRGNSMWGLTEWNPPETKTRTRGSKSSAKVLQQNADPENI